MGKKDQRMRQRAAALRLNGLKALKRGDYDEALDIWEGIEPQNLQTSEGIVEAHFRRGLKRLYGPNTDDEAGMEDLKLAFDLQPEDPVYAYHYALACHHLGELEEALRAYQVALHGQDDLRERVAYPLALANQQLGQDPSKLPVWDMLNATEHAMLEQISAFSRRPYTISSQAPILWQGIAALDQGEDEKAVQLLTQGMETDSQPSRNLAHYYLGVLSARRGDLQDARKHWTTDYAQGYRSPRCEHNLAQVYHDIAETYLENDQPQEALAAAEEANRYKTQNSLEELISQAHQRLAYQAAEAGQWQEAETHWKKAYQIEDGNFRLIFNLALAYEKDGRFIEAGEAWREALRRRPRRDDDPDALTDEEVAQIWRRAAEAYQKAGDLEESIYVYRQAVKYNPDSLAIRHQLARGLTEVGRLEAAENEYDRILERDSNDVEALLRRGELVVSSQSWWRQGNLTRYWERVLAIEPDHDEARQLLADYYVDLVERHFANYSLQDILEKYQTALEYQPDSSRALTGLAHYHLQADDLEQAQEYLDRALANASDDLIIYDDVIAVWLQNNMLEQAWQVMEQVEAQIENIPFQFYLDQGRYCLYRNDADMARPWLQRAEELAPKGYPILVEIAQMAVLEDELEIGKEYLDRAWKANRHIMDVHLVLGIYYAKADNIKRARQHWQQAEQIARRRRDIDMLKRIEVTRMRFDLDSGLLDLLMNEFSDGLPDIPDLFS